MSSDVGAVAAPSVTTRTGRQILRRHGEQAGTWIDVSDIASLARHSMPAHDLVEEGVIGRETIGVWCGKSIDPNGRPAFVRHRCCLLVDTRIDKCRGPLLEVGRYRFGLVRRPDQLSDLFPFALETGSAIQACCFGQQTLAGAYCMG